MRSYARAQFSSVLCTLSFYLCRSKRLTSNGAAGVFSSRSRQADRHQQIQNLGAHTHRCAEQRQNLWPSCRPTFGPARLTCWKRPVTGQSAPNPMMIKSLLNATLPRLHRPFERLAGRSMRHRRLSHRKWARADLRRRFRKFKITGSARDGRGGRLSTIVRTRALRGHSQPPKRSIVGNMTDVE